MPVCPSCGKEIEGSGYEFGTEIRTACYQCPCGGRVYVDRTSPETYRNLGVKPSKPKRHRRRFHCRKCNELIIRNRNENDELEALRRHYKEAHQNQPLPNTYIIADCDLTKRQKEALGYVRDLWRQLDSIAPDILRDVKNKDSTVHSSK